MSNGWDWINRRGRFGGRRRSRICNRHSLDGSRRCSTCRKCHRQCVGGERLQLAALRKPRALAGDEACKHAGEKHTADGCDCVPLTCRNLGLIAGGTVAVDGSRMGAVNARDRNFTPTTIQRRMEQVDASIQRYLGISTPPTGSRARQLSCAPRG